MANYKAQENMTNVPLYVCGEWLKTVDGTKFTKVTSEIEAYH